MVEASSSNTKQRPSKLSFWDTWVAGGRQEVILIRQQIDTQIHDNAHANTTKTVGE